jgi:hypothetical protein
MSEYASPNQCAIYVLSAFPIPESDAEIPSRDVADFFFRRNLPAAQCVVGVRHCVAMGWVQLLPENRLRLLEPGVVFLTDHSGISYRPPLRRRQ